MEVLEKYRELIEANSDDISVWWKLLPISFYLLSAISSYAAAILFYLLWHEIFAGNCPLWAEIVSPMRSRLMPDSIPIEVISPGVGSLDWRRQIFVAFKYETRCEFYHFVCLCSCLFGIAWLILFAMCGKGGYDTRIFVAPWRVVPPALFFQLIFAILTLIVAYDLEYGYSQFATQLYKIPFRLNDTQLATRESEMNNTFVKILSWIMACSWVFGLIVMTLRVVTISDFKLLTVTIHKIPEDRIRKDSREGESLESLENV